MTRSALPPLAILAILAFRLGAGPARADEPAPAIQDAIEAWFQPQMMYPGTTEWRYLSAHPFFSNTLWCGQVNAMDGAKHYMGFRAFYAIVSSAAKVSEAQMSGGRTEDPAGTISAKLKLLCGADGVDP